MINLKNEYDIVIVDSGVNLKHPILQGREIDGFAVNIQSGVLQIDEDYQDYYGHGTAIYSIISKAAPDAKILNIKVLNQDDGFLTCNTPGLRYQRRRKASALRGKGAAAWRAGFRALQGKAAALLAATLHKKEGASSATGSASSFFR